MGNLKLYSGPTGQLINREVVLNRQFYNQFYFVLVSVNGLQFGALPYVMDYFTGNEFSQWKRERIAANIVTLADDLIKGHSNYNQGRRLSQFIGLELFDRLLKFYLSGASWHEAEMRIHIEDGSWLKKVH